MKIVFSLAQILFEFFFWATEQRLWTNQRPTRATDRRSTEQLCWNHHFTSPSHFAQGKTALVKKNMATSHKCNWYFWKDTIFWFIGWRMFVLYIFFNIILLFSNENRLKPNSYSKWNKMVCFCLIEREFLKTRFSRCMLYKISTMPRLAQIETCFFWDNSS